MVRILAVLNTFGLNNPPSGLDYSLEPLSVRKAIIDDGGQASTGSNHVLANLKRWEKQKTNNIEIDLVLTDCKCGAEFREYFSNFSIDSPNIRFHYFYSDHFDGPFVYFNAVIERFGHNYDFFIYNTADCLFTKIDDLYNLINQYRADIGIISPLVDKDCLPGLSVDVQNNFANKVRHGEITYMPVGLTVHHHFIIFTNYFMEKFNYKTPTALLLGGWEWLTPFLSSSIRKLIYISNKVELEHLVLSIYGRKKEKYTNKIKRLRTQLESGSQFGIGYPPNVKIGKKLLSTNFPINFDMFDSGLLYNRGDGLYNFLIDNFFENTQLLDCKLISRYLQ